MSFGKHVVGIMHELIRVSGYNLDYGKSAHVVEIRRELHATKGWRVISVKHGITTANFRKDRIKPYQAVYKHYRTRRHLPGRQLLPFRS